LKKLQGEYVDEKIIEFEWEMKKTPFKIFDSFKIEF